LVGKSKSPDTLSRAEGGFRTAQKENSDKTVENRDEQTPEKLNRRRKRILNRCPLADRQLPGRQVAALKTEGRKGARIAGSYRC